MSRKSQDQKHWKTQVQTLGFRQTAIGFLRERLQREDEKERVDSLIRRLSKYDPQREIIKILSMNPVWQHPIDELVRELPEVSSEPDIHFVFQGGVNVPKVPILDENRLFFGCAENLYALDAETGSVIWSLQNPGKTWSTANISEDFLYVCSGGRLFALSSFDASERWCFAVGKGLSTPYAHQDKVFVGSEEGTLYALDAETGSRLWTFNVVKSISVAPGVWQNKIFAVSKDHCVYAIRMDDGECIWHFATGGKIYGVPHVTEGIVYLTSTDQKVYALFAASGQLSWSFVTGGEIYTSPFEENGLVYVSSRDRHLYVLRAEDGKDLWRFKTFGYPTSPTACRGMVYFSSQGRIYGISVADHKMRWSFPLGFTVATSPVVGQKRIYSGTLEGKLVCLRLKTEMDEQGATQVLKQFLDPEPEPEGH
jgi:outer membrane protein assembly factor BamB